MNGFIGNTGRDDPGYPDRPRAFINYVLLDEQFRYVSGGFSVVENTAGVVKTHIDLQNIAVTKNGYLYVYASNESPVNVFFDNIQVVHTRGPLLEETHYYPFGLTMAGISSKAMAFGDPQNRYKFNAGTELNSDFDINLYETNFRGLDPQLGRFWQIDPLSEFAYDNSPYVFGSNNPISINDPTGLQDSLHKETSTPHKPKVLEEVVVTSSYKKNEASNGWQSWMTTMGWGALGADSYLNLKYKGDWMYRTSQGKLQSIFDTKWGANKSAEELGNIARYSKNARLAIRTTKFAKYLKVGGKVVIVLSVLSDANDVLKAYLNNDPDATAIYGKAAVNTAMTGVGFIPGVGWVISGLYFTIDATIGWPAAIQSYIEIEKNKAQMRKANIMTFSDFKY